MTSETPPESLTPADQNVLRAAFLEKRETANTVATRLYVSRATYYRRLRAALAALTEAAFAARPPENQSPGT